MSVDFPAPFSPSNMCTSPPLSVRSTPASATTPGKDFRMPRISRIGPAGPGEPAPGSGNFPDPRSRPPESWLEANSQRQLHDARVAGEGRDHAGVGGGDVRRRQAEVRAIED